MADYPLPECHFQVRWGGADPGVVQVSGQGIENQMVAYREGLRPVGSCVKMPGLPKYGNLTPRRGVLPDDNMFSDRLNTIRPSRAGADNGERRVLIISLLNKNHEPVMTWEAANAFPVKVAGPGLKAAGDEAAVESMAIAHEGLIIQNG